MKKQLNYIITVFTFSFFCIICNAQNSRRYEKETISFLNSVRVNEHILSLDTIQILNYLSNSGLYKYLVLYGKNWAKGYLSEKDKNYFLKLRLDTSKFFLPKNCIINANLVSYNKNQNYIQMAKPIFLRNYTICIFSYGSLNEEGFQQTYLFKKVNNDWKKFKLLGGIQNY